MTDTPPKRGRGRPRREGADDEILAVALAMLREEGYRAITVDGVAERAGVAKTTVYRRWPSKGALLAAAIAPLVTDENVEEMLQLVTPVDGEALEVIRTILAPRRDDARTGAILVNLLLR